MEKILELMSKDETLQRKNGELNQSEAARKFGIGQPTLNRWTMGTSGISLEYKLRVLMHYNVPPQEYLNGQEMDYLHMLRRYLNSHMK